jgi:hypothetical protein
MKATKMDHPNDGIRCSVNTCYYYMQGDHCSADHIQVEPKDAMTSEQTDCATFFSNTIAK